MSRGRAEGATALRRRIFVGDIQGCRQELELLLEEVGYGDGDQLYSVGDVINRGPDSAGVIRLLRRLDAIAVMGNHELHLLEVVAGRHPAGGRDTLETILRAPDRHELLAWVRARPVIHCEDDLVLVHAAMHPSWTDAEATARWLNLRLERMIVSDEPLEDETIGFAVYARYCDEQGRLPQQDWPEPDPPFRPWDEHWTGRRVVFGHWARRGLVETDRVRGLDTGCVYGGQLTAWIAEEDRIVQVPALRPHCEK